MGFKTKIWTFSYKQVLLLRLGLAHPRLSRTRVRKRRRLLTFDLSGEYANSPFLLLNRETKLNAFELSFDHPSDIGKERGPFGCHPSVR